MLKVINYELPQDLESYVHRIGRTARAGADGVALAASIRSEQVVTGEATVESAPIALTMVNPELRDE